MTDQRIEALIAKAEITEKIYLYGRGCDRADINILKSLYHPDAIEDHGVFKGKAHDFCEMVARESPRIPSMSHHLSNVVIELEGEMAHSECYFLATGFGQEKGAPDVMIGGRYLDRFEKRSGEWKVADRQVVFDWYLLVDGGARWDNAAAAQWKPHGAKKPDDLLYKLLPRLLGTRPG